MERAVSYQELLSKKYETVEFDGEFAASFGPEVELNGVWIIYGDSANGKTSGSLKVARYLTRFGKVAYNTLEERGRFSFASAVRRYPFDAVERRRFIVLKGESMDALSARLAKKKSPDFIFIDSLQYAGLTTRKLHELVDAHPKKLFIFISHVEGKKPKGSLGEWVWYGSDVKMRAEGFKFFMDSRFAFGIGNQDLVINEERAAKYWSAFE